MKRKLIAIAMSLCLSYSSIAIAYGDEQVNEEPATEQTEATTEEETTTKETTTEATTSESETTSNEQTTEADIKTTEPTTSSTTTTTKESNSNRYTEESKQFSVTIGEGATASLTSYMDRSISISADSFDWYCTDTNVATVSDKGMLTGVKAGSATVTARGIDGPVRYTYTYDITVTEETEATATKSVSVYEDKDKDLYDYVDDSYNAGDYTWTSSDTKYVTVSSRGIITGEKEGSATVTAVYNKNGKYLKYEFKVRVYDNDDEDSNINHSSSSKYSSSSSSSSKYSSSYTTAYIKTSWNLYMGPDDSIDLGDILEEDPDEYDWNVNDEDVVEVDEDSGVITALDEGSAKVTANGDTDFTFTIKVSEDYSVQEISIRGTSTEDLDDYLSGDMDEYHFSSNREDVLEVDSDGEMTPVANGTVAVTCERDGGEIVMFMVTVSGVSTEKTTYSYNNEYTEITTNSAFATTKSSATTFTDISHRAWAIDSINQMASKGIILGVGNNKFAPDNNCTRADFTIVLTKILGLGNMKASTNYSDVASTDYFYNYVGAARSHSIECGVTNDKFRPKDNITREEMMVMVYKGIVAVQGDTMNTDTAAIEKYTDAKDISEENKTAVAALVASGAISGTSDTTLEPKALITRAQMAVIMNKVDQMIN